MIRRRVLALCIAAVSATCGEDSAPSRDSVAYEFCEKAARRNGINPYGPDGLTAIGRCMEAYQKGQR